LHEAVLPFNIRRTDTGVKARIPADFQGAKIRTIPFQINNMRLFIAVMVWIQTTWRNVSLAKRSSKKRFVED
jgi:hypothetical protein